MFLGIDIGTSGVKAVIADDGGAVVSQAGAALSVQRPHTGWSEQDPQAWWTATLSAVRALPAADRAAVRGVGLSGQMHGATLLDAADRPLRPAILWNDGRSSAQCAALEAREPRSRDITGNLAMPGFTAPKLLWVAEHEPGLFSRVASVLLPKDFVRLQLTGEKCSDMSDASGTLWLDVGRREWSDAMLAASGMKHTQMPRLCEGTAPAGHLTGQAAAALGVPRVPVAGGGGDNAASAAGLGVVRPGDAFLSLGTSGVLFVVNDRFRPNPQRAAHAFCHCVPAIWHQMSVLLSAGAALEWAVAATGSADLPSAVMAAQWRGIVASTPLFLPYLSGERTPHNDAGARAVFFGMDAGTTATDLIVAALTGVALAFADGLDVLLETGSVVADPTVCGGGSRLDYWVTLIASALNRPLMRRQGGETGAALGAALLGRAAVEGRSDAAAFPVPSLERVFEPDPALARQLSDLRPAFQQLYTTLKPSFKETSS
jgi:xylulokinase